MSKSLHHSFDVAYASIYGIEAAIMIHHFQFWIQLNYNKKNNEYEGRTWMYQSLSDIAANFPYLTESQVFEIIEKLCRGKSRRSKKTELDFEPVLMKGNFNKTKYDQTVWYSFINQEKFISIKKSSIPSLVNAKLVIGKCQNEVWQMPIPIPDTKTDAETDTKKTHPIAPQPKEPEKPKPPKKKAATAARVCVSLGSHVKLTKEEYAKLSEEYGEKTIRTIIEEMNDYCEASRPKGYSGYAAAIRQWMRKRLGQGVQGKKERKFAPCSDDDKAYEYLLEMEKDSI